MLSNCQELVSILDLVIGVVTFIVQFISAIYVISNTFIANASVLVPWVFAMAMSIFVVIIVLLLWLLNIFSQAGSLRQD